jgi:hypothetical protein
MICRVIVVLSFFFKIVKVIGTDMNIEINIYIAIAVDID